MLFIFLFLFIFNVLFSQEIAVQFTGGTQDSEQYFPGTYGGFGQSFTVGNENITVSRIDLELRKSGTPSDIYIQVRSGSMSGTVLGQSNVVSASSLSETYSWVSFTFNTPISLSANTKYYIALLSGGSVGYVYWRCIYSGTDQYPGGEMWRYVDWSTVQYPNYYDANFKVYKGVTDTEAPAAITTLEALVGDSGGEIKLRWLAVGDDGFSGNIIDGAYGIQRSTWSEVVFSTYSTDTIVFSTGTTSNPVIPYTQQSYILKNLLEGVTYYIRIWTQDDAGNWSSVSNGATIWAQVYPSPQDVKIVNVSVSSITVGWQREPAAAGYILQVSSVSSNFLIIHRSSITFDINLSTLTVSGLNSNTTYFIRVGYLYASTTKWMQNPLFLSTATLSEVVSNVSFLNVFESSITLSWSSVNCVGYILEASTSANFLGTVLSSSTSNNLLTQLTVTNLFSNTTYYFRVGTLNWNYVANYTTTKATSTLARPVEEPKIYIVSESSVTLSWKSHPLFPSSSSCSGYVVEASSTNFGQFLPGGVIHSTSTRDVNLSTLTIVNLLSSTTYWFRVGALNWNSVANYVYVDSTRTLSDITPPAAITTLSALSGSVEGEIKLTWIAPGDNGWVGDIVGGRYRIRYSTYVAVTSDFWTTGTWNDYQNKYEIEWTTNTSPLANQIKLLTALRSGVTYYIRIWTADEVPNWSGISNAATTWAQVDIITPSAITTLSGLVINQSDIRLSWISPGDDGTVGVINNGKFIIRYSTYNGDTNYWNSPTGWVDYFNRYELTITTSNILPFSEQFITITGLKNSTTYYFYIWTVDDSNNKSDISNLFYIYILDTIPPANITDLVATTNFIGVKEGEIKLIWTSVGDDGYEGYANKYIIKVSTLNNINDENDFLLAKDISEFSNVSLPQPSLSGNKEELIITNLEPGGTYFFAVKVEDESGNTSQWLRTLVINRNNYTIAFDTVPPPVENVYVLYQQQELKVMWSYNFDKVVDFDYFEVHWSTSYDNWIIHQTTLTYITLQNPKDITTYYFRIYAVDEPPCVLKSGVKEVSFYVQESQQQDVPPQPINTFYGIAVSSVSILWEWKYSSLNVKEIRIYSYNDELIYSKQIDISSPTGRWLQEGLLPNTSSYVYYIIALNDFGMSSPTYVTGSVYTLSNPPSDVEFIMISSNVYKINFSSNSNPSHTRYAIYISSDGVNFEKIKDKEDNFTIGNIEELYLELEIDTIYYFKLFSYNEQDIISEQIVISTSTYDDTPPAKITDLKAEVIANKVFLTWTSVGDNGLQKDLVNGKYIIKYSTSYESLLENPLFIIELSTSSKIGIKESIVLESLPENTTIYISIEVIDDYGNISDISNVVSIYIDLGIAPKYVAGIKVGEISPTVLMLRWSPVTRNEDNTINEDLSEYRIYKSTTNLENFHFLGCVSSNTFQFIDIAFNRIFSYYTVKAINSKGKESEVKMIVASDGTVIFKSKDNKVSVNLPTSVNKILYKENNIYNDDLIVDIKEVNFSGYLYTYNVSLMDYKNDTYLSLQRLENNFEIEFFVSGYVVELISVYYWYEKDKSLKVPSEFYSNENKIKIKTPLLGMYSLKETKKFDTTVKLDKVFPRIFTPLSENSKFNAVKFYFSNPQNLKLTGFRIFDVYGNLVRNNLREILPNLIYEWDGRDDSGKVLPSGVYLYEASFEKNLIFNGSIILAK